MSEGTGGLFYFSSIKTHCVLDGIVFTLYFLIHGYLFFLSWKNNLSCILISAPLLLFDYSASEILM